MLNEEKLAALRATSCEPNRVRVAMALLPVTQVQLAEAIGVEQSTISKVVTGRHSRLPLALAQKLAGYFGCQVEDLFPSRQAVA